MANDHDSAFPTPEWPPIPNVDRIDIIAQRRDGGVDLVIAASQPLDDSPATLESIRQKVRAYLAVIGSKQFQAEMGHPPSDKTTILLVCEHPIHPRALSVIAQCEVLAVNQGVRLEVRTSFDAPPIPLPSAGDQMRKSIRPATEADRTAIAAHVSSVLAALRSCYGDVQLRRTEDDLHLLQRLHDDGELRAGREQQLEEVGIVFGEVLAAQTPLRWISVEWEGERSLGLQYPGTTVIVFPGSMIVKRVNRGERVEFESLFRGTVAQVEELKDDPECRL